MKKLIAFTLVAALGGSLTACEIDVPDLNNPSIDDLETNPTTASVSAACTGLLIGNRRNTAQANGYVAQLGILGREAYNFDQADPRFIGELLEGNLSSGSPFGGNFWAGPYANIRLANTIQRVVGNVPEFSGEERSAILGFTKTIEAHDLLEVAVTRDTNGGVIDTDKKLDEALGAVVDKPALYAEIVKLLDEGATDLMNGGDAFPFSLSTGYEGFDDPMTFRTFNRAIRARAAIYLEDYAGANTALGMSFIMDAPGADMSLGVYHSYSTGAGDQVNNLINPNIYAHPSLKPGPMGAEANDDRYAAKVTMVAPEDAGGAGGLSSDIVFTHYAGPSADVPIIRNEELILLKAEALYFTNDKAGALVALNLVRVESGGLAPLVAADIDMETEFTTRLLYERRFSLLFEGGHRWIDLRRFMVEVPLLPSEADHTRNIRYPIPLQECNARPGEPRCSLGST